MRYGEVTDTHDQRAFIFLHRLVIITRPVQLHQPERPAFANLISFHQSVSNHFLAPRLYNFFEISSCSMCLSRLRSATSFFKLAFSSSSCFSRLNSLIPMPAYLSFHRWYVCSLTPNSRHTSAIFRPPSTCLRPLMIRSLLYRCPLLFMGGSFSCFISFFTHATLNLCWSSFSGSGQF